MDISIHGIEKIEEVTKERSYINMASKEEKFFVKKVEVFSQTGSVTFTLYSDQKENLDFTEG